MNYTEIFDSFKNGNKTNMKYIIDKNPDFEYKLNIFISCVFFDFETIKFIFEYYEKINRKIEIEYMFMGIASVREKKVLDYLKYLKKHNYETSNYEITEQPTTFYHLSLLYAIKKNTHQNIQYKKNCYVNDNTIIYEDYSNHIFRLNYVIYLSK